MLIRYYTGSRYFFWNVVRVTYLLTAVRIGTCCQQLSVCTLSLFLKKKRLQDPTFALFLISSYFKLQSNMVWPILKIGILVVRTLGTSTLLLEETAGCKSLSLLLSPFYLLIAKPVATKFGKHAAENAFVHNLVLRSARKWHAWGTSP